MKLIFCLSKEGGMTFFGKRQSQDIKLREWILNRVSSSKLWMNEYSYKMFGSHEGIEVSDLYMSKAGADDYCFIENGGYSAENADEIILCHWNRKYPADKFFDIEILKNGFELKERADIVGNSHEKITIEVYGKK